MSSKALAKSMGLGALLVYGVGDILGAGIYALLGKVVGEAGSYAWLAFVVAMGIAFLTALGYSELTSRFPKSGGASHFVQVAFGRRPLSFLAGWLLLCVSVVSMATLSRAFHGYLQSLGAQLPLALVIAGFLALVTGINLWGIRQSSFTNMVSTAVEVTGLLIVVAAGAYMLLGAGGEPLAPQGTLRPLGVLEGAALAFYAFIGFEDLANVAEEAKDAKRHLPIAILGSLAFAGAFYALIAWLAVRTVAPAELAQSTAPLAAVVERSGLGVPVQIFSLVALFAVANTCLLNFITGSRLLYGMAKEKLAPSPFAKLHPRFHTPFVAILAILPVVFALALLGDLAFLAGTTSVLILAVFCFTNASLLRIKFTQKDSRGGGFRVPAFVPGLGLVSSFGLLVFNQGKSLLLAGAIALAGALIYFVLSRTVLKESKRRSAKAA